MVPDLDHLRRVEIGGIGAGVEIAPQGAEVQDAVTALDELPNLGVHEAAVVHADVLRVGLVQGRFIHQHGGKGEARGLHQGQGRGAAPQAGNEIARQDGGGLGLGELLGHGVDRFGQRGRVTGGSRRGRHGCRSLRKRGIGIVGRDSQINGAPVGEGGGDQALHLGDGVLRRQDGAGADGRLGHLHEQIEFAVPQGVMDEAMFPLGPDIGHADQVKHGQMFAIGAGDAAQGDQFAHAEGRGQRAQNR